MKGIINLAKEFLARKTTIVGKVPVVGRTVLRWNKRRTVGRTVFTTVCGSEETRLVDVSFTGSLPLTQVVGKGREKEIHLDLDAVKEVILHLINFVNTKLANWQVTASRPDAVKRSGGRTIVTFRVVRKGDLLIKKISGTSIPNIRIEADDIGKMFKYGNHEWFGNPLAVLVKRIATADSGDSRYDGMAFCAISEYRRLIDIESLRDVWAEEKIKLLEEPRVIKPVLFGPAVFGKGILVPIPDREFISRGGSLGEPIPMILADDNFVKLSDPQKEIQPGVYLGWMGIHDAPVFAEADIRKITASVLLRLVFDKKEQQLVNDEFTKNLQSLRKRAMAEGLDFLISENFTGEEEDEDCLEKDLWLHQAIFTGKLAAKKKQVIARKAMNYVFNLKAVFSSGYAVSPTGSLADRYTNGRYKFNTVLLHPAQFKAFRKKVGADRKADAVTATVLRHPKLHLLGAWECQVMADPLVPRGAVVVHPDLWMNLGMGDHDGDTVTIYKFRNGVIGAAPLTQEMAQAFPKVKGATPGTFKGARLEQIIASAMACQAAVGYIDSLAFMAQLDNHLKGKEVVTEAMAAGFDLRGLFETQTLLTGIKKPVSTAEFSALRSIPLWTKVMRGKEASVQNPRAKGEFIDWTEGLDLVAADAVGTPYSDLISSVIATLKGIKVVEPTMAGELSRWGLPGDEKLYTAISDAEKASRGAQTIRRFVAGKWHVTHIDNGDGRPGDDSDYQRIKELVAEAVEEQIARYRNWALSNRDAEHVFGFFSVGGDVLEEIRKDALKRLLLWAGEGKAGTYRENWLNWLQKASGRDLGGLVPELEYRIVYEAPGEPDTKEDMK